MALLVVPLLNAPRQAKTRRSCRRALMKFTGVQPLGQMLCPFVPLFKWSLAFETAVLHLRDRGHVTLVLPTGNAGERFPRAACYRRENGTSEAKPTLLPPAPRSNPAVGYCCLAHSPLLWDILNALHRLSGGADHFPGKQLSPQHVHVGRRQLPHDSLAVFSPLFPYSAQSSFVIRRQPHTQVFTEDVKKLGVWGAPTKPRLGFFSEMYPGEASGVSLFHRSFLIVTVQHRPRKKSRSCKAKHGCGTGLVSNPLSFLPPSVCFFLFQVQASWLQHDLGHLSVFREITWNRLLHKFVMCHLIVSTRPWKNLFGVMAFL